MATLELFVTTRAPVHHRPTTKPLNSLPTSTKKTLKSPSPLPRPHIIVFIVLRNHDYDLHSAVKEPKFLRLYTVSSPIFVFSLTSAMKADILNPGIFTILDLIFNSFSFYTSSSDSK
ncbi:hypothetical protein L2E82_03112 [Cichorium intybus]|uniref:Uncharacterized protein n=1 Tax=Cichorium intybus TaxID=13427 RepID=A0ACB9H4N8_CICIN|nr:hypothetical protein L2E82_03112 [Cichorium intybus]